MRIRTQILCGTLLPLLLALVLSQAFADRTARRAFLHAAERELAVLAVERGAAVEARVKAWRLEAELAAGSELLAERAELLLERPFPKHRASVERALEALVAEGSGVLRSDLYDARGQHRAGSDFATERPGAPWSRGIGPEPGPGVQLGVDLTGGTPVAIALAPVIKEGHLVGHLSVTRSFSQILGLIAASPAGGDRQQLVLLPGSEGHMQVVVSDTPHLPVGPVAANALEQGGRLELGGETWVVASQQAPGHLLGTAALVPLHTALAEARAFRAGLFGLSLLVFSGVFAALWFVSRRIVEPIESMARVAADVGEGDLEARAPEEGSREVAVLGQTFNSMLAELEQRRRGLEEQVAERTAALERSNTALEVQKRDLARSNADLTEFAYVASHDLRTPLRGIANLAAWIEEDLGDAASESTAEYLELMKGRVVRLERLLTDLLAYARAGRDEEPLEEVDVPEMVREIVDLEGARRDLTLELDWRAGPVLTRRVPLHTVLQNLISNSVKYGAVEGLVLTLEGELVDGVLRCRFRDNGPGIDPAHHERVFQVFQTLGHKGDGLGTGIGLALVRKLVELHGGRITILESGPGSGLSMEFTWRPGRPGAHEPPGALPTDDPRNEPEASWLRLI